MTLLCTNREAARETPRTPTVGNTNCAGSDHRRQSPLLPISTQQHMGSALWAGGYLSTDPDR